MSNGGLVKAYIEALRGRAIYVHAGLLGRDTHIGFTAFRKKGLAAKFWFAKAATAELVVRRCEHDFAVAGAIREHGWIELPPSEVIDRITSNAAEIGANWKTEQDVQRDATRIVAEIVREVEAARQNGSLQEVNQEYKRYRQAQIEKGEAAIPYSAHIAQFTRLMVVRAAERSITG